MRGPDPPLWVRLAKDVAADRKIDDSELETALAPFGIADNEGFLTIPVVEAAFHDLP